MATISTEKVFLKKTGDVTKKITYSGVISEISPSLSISISLL